MAKGQGADLVMGIGDLQFAVAVNDEPGPAGAEVAHGFGGEGFQESINRAEFGAQGTGQGVAGLGGTTGSHAFPEEGVVVITATMVDDRGALVSGDAVEAG